MFFRKASYIDVDNILQAIPSNPISQLCLSPITLLCNLKVLLDLTDVQKMQLHSWRVVILSREYSQRHSLQVSSGSRAKSPASDLSAVMVRGQAFPAEPILSPIVRSAWKEKSTAETSHIFTSHWSKNLQLGSIKAPAHLNVPLQHG